MGPMANPPPDPPPERPAATFLPMCWLAFLCGAIVVALADVLPWRLTFVRPDNLLACFTEVQLFFAFFAWPLFIPSLAARGEARPLLREAGTLVLLGLPPALACANVSNAGAAGFLRAQALVAAAAALVAAIHALGLRRGWRVGPWYVLGAFLVSAGLPYLAFLLYEFGGEGDLPWIAALSPFWAGSRVDGAGSLLHAAAWAALAGGLFAAARIPRRGEAP